MAGTMGPAYASDSSIPLPTRLNHDLTRTRFDLVDEDVEVVVFEMSDVEDVFDVAARVTGVESAMGSSKREESMLLRLDFSAMVDLKSMICCVVL